MNESIWQQHTTSRIFTPLEQDVQVDVTVIGAGLCGIYTAYLLAKRGLNVLLVEASETIGGGATKRSTGKLTAQHGAIYQQLNEADRLSYYVANEQSISKVLPLLSSKSYEKVTSYIFCEKENDVQTIQNEYECYKKLPFAPIATKEIELPIPIQLAIGMPNMYQINPAQFTNELIELAVREGVKVHTKTRVTTLNLANKTAVTEGNFTITSKYIVLCSHYPIESIRNLYTLKLRVVRSYLSATPTFDHVPNHYLSIGQNARTIRTAIIDNQKYFIYGGGEHLAGTVQETETFYHTLLNEINHNYSIDANAHVWSSQDIETADALPYVGPVSKNEDGVYIATGFKKWGLSTSLVSAEIIASSIVREYHPAKDLFNPHRSLTGTQFVFNIAQGSFIVEQLIASYATRLSAPKCTHLGCRTRWNEADRTWDCPCHGSRFAEDGHVIEGPAVYPLKFE